MTLINNVLDRSMLEAGRLTVNLSRVNLAALLDEVVQMFTLTAAEKGLWLTVVRDPQSPKLIDTDAVRLRQVLINLVSNAIKLTEQGGVTITATPCLQGATADTSNYVWFEVADTGPGIDPMDLPHLFDAFAQRVSGHSIVGAGLRLWISREIVRLLGGELTVASVGGAGARFRFALPAQESAAESDHLASVARRAIGLAPDQPRYRTLIADDNQSNRGLLRQFLEAMGCDVREAKDGAEALAEWQAWQPHLVWMDVRMPVLDGAEVTRRIKDTSQGHATLVIALTADDVIDDANSEMRAGYDAVVRKPFREEELVALMEQRLGAQFIEASDSAMPAAPSSETPPVASAGMARIPPELLGRLEQAALIADMNSVKALIAEIRAHDAAVAQQFSLLSEGFEYPRIVQMIQAFKSEAPAPHR